MNGSWKMAACVAAWMGAFGLLLICASGAGYLDRASPPDAIELGIGVQTPNGSFWFGIRGTKNPDSEKGHVPAKVDGLSSYK